MFGRDSMAKLSMSHHVFISSGVGGHLGCRCTFAVMLLWMFVYHFLYGAMVFIPLSLCLGVVQLNQMIILLTARLFPEVIFIIFYPPKKAYKSQYLHTLAINW